MLVSGQYASASVKQKSTTIEKNQKKFDGYYVVSLYSVARLKDQMDTEAYGNTKSKNNHACLSLPRCVVRLAERSRAPYPRTLLNPQWRS